MPYKTETAVKWQQHYAWWPVRSGWSKKVIWLKKYWVGHIYYDAMGRPPIKSSSWKVIYTENEYLLMLLRENSSPPSTPLISLGPKPGY